jgi:hypothetical protein
MLFRGGARPEAQVGFGGSLHPWVFATASGQASGGWQVFRLGRPAMNDAIAIIRRTGPQVGGQDQWAKQHSVHRLVSR